MISLTELVAGILITGFMRVLYAAANADSSTGFVRDHRPTEAWSTQNKPSRVTKDITASECAMNTRLDFPNV
ncbi:hypothetical protein PCANC_21615 [Puccinia coronata f. sp. avenae]|uniref:Secreted protein n=1 Tax=Puccinia coronata f. sp. avenae TaxID=200324 RepID=A0A2N5TTI6_9BASI|nr:hypothetical protein PCANC_21490 [Puccinia coronata f. sp. avenae]PLW28789.1 hypothetical protein PCANC_21615 [Puccinia coronata f. sp. avenae]